MTTACLPADLMPAATKKARRQLLAPAELKTVGPLAAASGLRMFGLFLMLPVLAPYVAGLPGGSLQLAGLAVGVYGLTQAFMLVPMGWLSDLVGRRPVLVAGLAVFAAGGLLAASVEHPAVVILGRALQGLGAISAVVLATVAEATAEKRRSQGMALVGAGVALAFGAAMVLAVPLGQAFGVPALLLATAALGAAAAVGMAFAPLPPRAKPRPLSDMLVDFRILPYCAGVFGIHFAMAALFVILPLRLAEDADWVWAVYGSAFAVSLALAVPFIVRGSASTGLLAAAAAALALGVTALPFASGASLVAAAAFLAVFFAGFNYLEATLPVRVSHLAVPGSRGAAMGIYSISQAFGVFAGGYVAGTVAETYNYAGMLVGAAMVVAWIPWLFIFENANKRK